METVIVTGVPGAGKSTVSRGLAHEFPRAARVAADDLNAMILSGAVWPLGQPASDARRQIDLCYRNLAALATNFSDAGFVTIIDCVLPDRVHLDRLMTLLAEGRGPRESHGRTSLVVLAPGEAACRARNARRAPEDRFDFDGYDELDRSMRQDFGDRGWWLDTSSLTAEATVRVIADGLRS